MSKPPRRLPAARAMITAPQPEAVEAGASVLKDGGNALDAVLACAFTQGVVDPLMCGIGGLGSMQIFDPASSEHLVLDGLSTCPAACTEDMWAADFERECSDGYGYVVKGGVNELGGIIDRGLEGRHRNLGPASVEITVQEAIERECAVVAFPILGRQVVVGHGAGRLNL